MWYRGTNPYNENNRLAKPLGLPVNKHKKKKVKQFDLSDDGEMPNLIEPVVEPKTPANIVETPDLPAGVDIPPAQHPPKEQILDEKPIHKNHKPKELEELYGEDHDIRDDSVITRPSPKKVDNDIKPPFETPDLDLEQGILDILDGKAEDEPVEEEPEEVAPEPEPEPDQSTQPVPNPPIHEFCHCEIITMPGGRRIWRANEGACSDCINARDTFNQWQLSLFGS